ncbi:MAG TPA: efflux RND transporter permease subunit, partial [Stellaceae bacterium]|nr:efflux RND transporter permease subunit [Stellaceae bacterium]
MSLPELCIRRPVMTTLLMLSFVIFGMFSYRLLPVAAIPRVDFPTILVTAVLPGASPDTMASSVATPLERQFSTIAGIDSMISTSGVGVTAITIQFNLNRNIDGAALDVQAAMTAAAKFLPPPSQMTTPPSFQKVNPADSPIIYLALASDTLPLYAVDEYAETLMAERIGTLPGVAQVQIFGSAKFAVRVQANPEALAAKGLSLDDLIAAVAAANSNTPIGLLDGAHQSFTLVATGILPHAADYRSIIVANRGGAPIRLGDVATIVDSVENTRIAAWYNGTRSGILSVLRQPDANTVDVVDSVKALIPVFREQLPPSVHLEVLADRSISIRQSVDDVQFTLAITVALVVLV